MPNLKFRVVMEIEDLEDEDATKESISADIEYHLEDFDYNISILEIEQIDDITTQNKI